MEFFLKAIRWSSEHGLGKIKQVLLLQEQLEKLLHQEKGASLRSLQFLELLFRNPLIEIQYVAEKLEVSFQAASTQTSLFVKLNILKELPKKGSRKRFAFAPYLEIIDD